MEKDKVKKQIKMSVLHLKGNAGTCVLNLLDNLAFYGYKRETHSLTNAKLNL